MGARATGAADNSITRLSAVYYTGTSLGMAVVFWILTQIVGGYPTAAIVGGAVWVFILSMIVSMPLYTGHFKRKSSMGKS